MRSWLVDPLAFLPPSLRAFLARRAFEGVGVVLIALGGFMLLAVMGWSIDDPSFNIATTRAPGNWMGLPGAYVADIMLQTLGLAGVLLLLPLFVWGARAFAHRRINLIAFRVAAWLAATLFAATALSALPRFAFWPLALGLGGLLGDGLAALGFSLFSPFTVDGVAYALTALLTAPIAFFLILFAADIALADLKAAAIWVRDLRKVTAAAEEERRYASGARPRRRAGEGEAPARPHRPAVEPSRLRILAWEIGDRLTDGLDRLMRRGDYAPLSQDEIDAARAGALGGFGQRGAGESAAERRARRREARNARIADERIEPKSDRPGPRVARTTRSR